MRWSAALPLVLKEIPDVVDVLPGGLPGMPCCILYFWDLLGGVTRKGDVFVVLTHCGTLSTIWMVVVQLKRPNRELV